jgi:hypothetical protein
MVRDYHCALCGKFQSKRPSKVRDHLEVIHFPGLYVYSCQLCDKTSQERMHVPCTTPLSIQDHSTFITSEHALFANSDLAINVGRRRDA